MTIKPRTKGTFGSTFCRPSASIGQKRPFGCIDASGAKVRTASTTFTKLPQVSNLRPWPMAGSMARNPLTWSPLRYMLLAWFWFCPLFLDDCRNDVNPKTSQDVYLRQGVWFEKHVMTKWFIMIDRLELPWLRVNGSCFGCKGLWIAGHCKDWRAIPLSKIQFLSDKETKCAPKPCSSIKASPSWCPQARVQQFPLLCVVWVSGHVINDYDIGGV